MRYCIVLVLLVLSLNGVAGRYVRYNLAGYHPERKKTLLIIADDNCINFPWSVKSSNGQEVLKGVVGPSITGAGDHTPKAFNHSIDFTAVTIEGPYTFEIANVDTFTVHILKDPYAIYTDEVLRYLRVQRSGTDQCLDHNVSHRGDTSCVVYRRNGVDNKSWSEDATRKKVNMLGGWYDAGDYIKFTLTTAYTTYFLLRSYEEYPELFKDKKNYSRTALCDMLDEAKWGMDYLMKCMPDTNEFIIQTGGYLDHEEGNRLPDKDFLNGKRECYSHFSPTHMGYTAAALALGARVFASAGTKEDARKYEEMAKQVFRIAQRHDVQENVAWFEKDFQFYADDSKNDNMALAAIELYELTKNDKYLTSAKQYCQLAGSAEWAAWTSVHMYAHLRVLPYAPQVKSLLDADLNQFLTNSILDKNNIWGAPHQYTWATLYSFFSVANGALLYSQATKNTKYERMTYDVVDYTFGRNNWGIAMIASQRIKPSIRNVYSQIYKLQYKLHPTGAIAEGPGDRATHDNLMRYFVIDANDPFHQFNAGKVVFFDNNTDFQSMETTIGGLADGLFMLTLASKYFK